MPDRPARHVSRITMRISSFHFPPPLHGIRPFFFFARQQFCCRAKRFGRPAGGHCRRFSRRIGLLFREHFFAASALRIRGSTDSACGRCAWLRLSTCAIFLSRLIRLIQGLVCCVRYPKKVYPPGGRMAVRRMLLWHEDLALDGGLASAQRHSRFATGIPTATHSTT